eukprot:CAMPEP_0170510456 /NCGR_PEP_ID=MMETSP0208-20121228/65777_1 /TAXON_ID=197538 /ORGANISM="Strombidium inclinatum, Strain S3" /LENGTH=134 /DNA_ID=CAMNT_0010793921 /DNA_START=1472 /DNA_END=1872 /DNA_ORIENTATION=-
MDNFMDLFITKFHIFNCHKLREVPRPWESGIMFSMNDQVGSYEGQIDSNGQPCGWGRWKGNDRVIYAHWTNDSLDDEERLDGLVMDLQRDKFFLGRYIGGERDHFGVWRKIQRGEPLHFSGFYVRGKLSGAFRG